MYRNLKICLLLLVTCYLLLVTPPAAQAQTMSNQNYIIQTEGINAISESMANISQNSQTAAGKSDPNASEGVNFKIKKGFENLASAPPFSISLSSDLVDFGTLSPTNPIIRTVNLNINSQATYGYSVIVFENEPFAMSSSDGKVVIPDTTCDNGRCGDQTASEWTNPLTYGFGYRCDNLAYMSSSDGRTTDGQTGADCNNSFAKPNFYKHFPDIANNDNPVSVMAGFGSNNKTTRISYKVNISGNQAQGIYGNIITYIAVPNF